MFKLTKDTDPKTIMLEGRPEIEIVALSDKDHNSNDRVAVYIEHADGLDKEWQAGLSHTSFKAMRQATHTNIYYDTDGTVSRRNFRGEELEPANWPRIVERFVIDTTKPIGVQLIRQDGRTNQSELDARGYFIRARVVPVIGNDPEMLMLGRLDSSYDLMIDPRTGRVPERTQAGANLQFFNRPDIVTDSNLVALKDGTLVRLEVTRTDGVISNIEWKQ
jgi:hypothetical protein